MYKVTDNVRKKHELENRYQKILANIWILSATLLYLLTQSIHGR